MGVYIKGMEMPKDGFITITVTSDGRVVGNSKKERGKFEYLKNEDLAKAVPVPEHGRLIDADAVALEGGPYEYDEWCKWALDQYQDAPTIIPADPAKEGKDERI